MKVPINCPVCGGALLNSFGIGRQGATIWKICTKRLDHNIEFLIDEYNDQKVNQFSINLPQLKVSWFTEEQKLTFTSSLSKNENSLPYFEPDLSDYRKLINKLKTYLVFS